MQKAIDKIKSMIVPGTEVELELREKEGAFFQGIVVELGDDYLLLERQASIQVDQGAETVSTKNYELTTLIFLKDVRAISKLKLLSQNQMLSNVHPQE